MPLKDRIYISLKDEHDWLTKLHNFVEKRKDVILANWVRDRMLTIETKIKKLNEQ